MSGMGKGSSLSVVNASATLTVAVTVVLVLRGSAQVQTHQLRQVRRDVGLSHLRDYSKYKETIHIRGVMMETDVPHASEPAIDGPTSVTNDI
jgi:hypothetical protein